MFNFLLSLIPLKKLLTDSRIKNHIRNVKHDESVKFMREQIESVLKHDYETMSEWMNRPVICITNENENPIVGYVVKVVIEKVRSRKICRLYVHDYVTGSEVVAPSVIKPFDEALLKLVTSQNKLLIADLLYGSLLRPVDRNKRPLLPIYNHDELRELLHHNGFYPELHEFK